MIISRFIKLASTAILYILLPLQIFAVTCPNCEKSFDEFLPVQGKVVARKAICPHCKSRERHRHIFLFLREHNLFTPNFSLLHWAAEGCLSNPIKAAYPDINYIKADIEPKGKTFIPMDITRIPLKDESIDGIICSHVLEHVIDDAQAIRECHRVLSPDGWAIFLVPINHSLEVSFEDASITSPEDRLRLFGQKDHVRWYGNDFKTRLENNGFTVNYFSVDSFPEETIMMYGLAPIANEFPVRSNDIYFCKKK